MNMRGGSPLSSKKRVLVTGSAGQIGTIIRSKLGYKYQLTGLDRAEHDWPRAFVADLSDLEAIRPAFEGQDTVVHMGGDPSPGARRINAHRSTNGSTTRRN